jgi:hypothetical protein
MELILTNRKLWTIVSGSEVKPNDKDAAAEWTKREQEA